MGSAERDQELDRGAVRIEPILDSVVAGDAHPAVVGHLKPVLARIGRDFRIDDRMIDDGETLNEALVELTTPSSGPAISGPICTP